MLQHGGVVAREFGKPCVSGVSGVTGKLKDGMLVEVDGTTGKIKILDDCSGGKMDESSSDEKKEDAKAMESVPPPSVTTAWGPTETTSDI